MKTSSRRSLPSVDAVVRELSAVVDLPRPMVVAVVRAELARIRRDPDGDAKPLEAIRAALDDLRRARIQPVINATGVIIHTNLGRAPLGARVVAALSEAAAQFTNLEYDLSAGQRGGRAPYVEKALAVLCAAESAAVVNNCAAALVLVLNQFAARPPRNEVIISRDQLVQIGGGFRIPDILESVGAVLREVGTTNKTTPDDFRRAINSKTALILKIHHSNFYMGGFVESPTTRQLSQIAREHNIPLLEDIGSGATFDTTTLGGPEREPTARETLAAGADLVCFSGDKLFGGPQAGILAGSAKLISALKHTPLFRALRCDKLILAALQATVELHLSGNDHEIPIRAMMQADPSHLRRRAERIVEALQHLPARIEIATPRAQIGGGSLPRTTLPSVSIAVRPDLPITAEILALRLRRAPTPIIAYIEDNCLTFDLRTVLADQDEKLASALRAALCPAAP